MEKQLAQLLKDNCSLHHQNCIAQEAKIILTESHLWWWVDLPSLLSVNFILSQLIHIINGYEMVFVIASSMSLFYLLLW